jgi:anti-anti-sigma factor
MPPESDGTYQACDQGLAITAHVLPGDAGRARLRLAGDIDLASSALLSKTIDWLTAMAPFSVLVDLAEVTFASSALPNFVVRLSQGVPHGVELILWRAPPMTGWVLRLTDMATIATLRDDPTLPYGVPA